MDEDARFPNRKKRQDWDISALDKPVGADPLASGGEQAEDAPLPVNVYRVVESAGKSPEEERKEREELYSFRESIPEAHRASVEAPVFLPIAEAPAFYQPLHQAKEPPRQGLRERIRKFAESQTRVYAAIGLGLGILLGVIVASVTWLTGAPNGRYDLGPVSSSAAGLKGHLFVEWDKSLNYRLTVEPDDQERLAAFALAVANSPHPLSVEIHLQDSQGFVLCSKEILLKFDAANAGNLAVPSPDAQSGKTDGSTATSDQPAPGGDAAQAEDQEAAREKGKDIFKNQVGPDGQITGLSAQGGIPCPAKSYEKAVAWSFSSTLPTIAEQDEMLDHHKEQANGGRSAAQTSAARNKVVAKPVQKLLTFSSEGDDTIVDFDGSRGIIETGAGKVFFIDQAGGAVSDPRWQDYPVEVHYRCDRSSECILMHSGAGALHVRLRR
jgi:hypothetical protein